VPALPVAIGRTAVSAGRCGDNAPIAERLRHETGIVVRTVGVITTAKQAEAIVTQGKADMVALALGKALKDVGLDYIDVSSGGATAKIRTPTSPGYTSYGAATCWLSGGLIALAAITMTCAKPSASS
jgi:2,4-dienoyl-CoA reductase-like NADH-dependent reductase (Old Yellow Enzyme family)